MCCFTVSSGTEQEQWKLRNGAVRRRQRSAEISSCESDARCMARLVKGLLGVAHHRGNTLSVVGRHLLVALQQGERQVVQNVSVGIRCVITDEEMAVGDSKVVHDDSGSVGAATQTDTRRRWSAQSLAVSADTQQMKQAPVDGYVAPLAEATFAAPAPVDEYVAPFTEATFAAPASVDGYVAPFTEATFAAPAPADGYVAPFAEATFAAPAPVDEYVAPFTEATFAAPASVDGYVAPFTEVTFAAPAPVDEYVAPFT